MTTYRSYHSALKIAYVQRALSKDVVKNIPKSTRHRWREKKHWSFWLPDPISDSCTNQIRLLQLTHTNRMLRLHLKALFRLVLLYRELTASCSFKQQQILKISNTLEHFLSYCNQYYPQKTIWRYLPFSCKQWQAWNGRRYCPISLQRLCRKQYPQQLAVTEQEIIREKCTCKDYEHWPLSSIYYQLLREGALRCSLSTFYKYCRRMGITRKRIRKPKLYRPLLAEAPLNILHQDITIFKTQDGVRHYLYVIRDNYSRAILACKVATEYSSHIAMQTLQKVLNRFQLTDKAGILITDDGPENNGALKTWLDRPGMLWKKLVAQLDIVQSNSMVEAANKIIKYRFLYTQPVTDTTALAAMVQKALTCYNSRPNAQLYGYTPHEVLAGAIPDKHRFRTQIAAAQKQRVNSNRTTACNMVCQT